MTKKTSYIDMTEELTVRCREIYRRFGYRRFAMSKFEDYDLYAQNRSFLVSDSILTFSDKSGRLKALKPDVTLSIVKNLGDRALPTKLFYNENVYRPDESGREFREIMQLGLESIGATDLYSTAEVIMLAALSLREIGEACILDLSHMGLLMPLLEGVGISGDEHAALLEAVKSRSVDGIRLIFSERRGEGSHEGDDVCALLCELVSTYAPLRDSLKRLNELFPDGNAAVSELFEIFTVLDACGLADNVYFDFSLINDMSYYNGVIFQGFVTGLPKAVLSGGRYDPLLARFGRNCGAVGFALYLDRICLPDKRSLDVYTDILLLYTDLDRGADVAKAVMDLSRNGVSVLAAKSRPEGASFGKILKFGGKSNA